MKNYDTRFKKVFANLERELKNKFPNFNILIDFYFSEKEKEKVGVYDFTQEYDVMYLDEDKATRYDELDVLYPTSPCYFGDLRKENKYKNIYFTCGLTEALIQLIRFVKGPKLEGGTDFLINLTPQDARFFRIEYSYYQKSKIVSVLLIRTFCYGYLSPKKGMLVKKDF